VLQCVAVRCSILQQCCSSVVVCGSVLQSVAVCERSVLQYFAVLCSMFSYVAVRCSVLQCVAVFEGTIRYAKYQSRHKDARGHPLFRTLSHPLAPSLALLCPLQRSASLSHVQKLQKSGSSEVDIFGGK